MLSKDEVLRKIKNESLIAYYEEFHRLTGLRIKFELLIGRIDRNNSRSEYEFAS